MKKFNTYSDQKSFWSDVCGVVSESFGDKYQEFFRLSVSGGSSANIIAELVSRDFEFEKTDIFQVDERCVPKDNKDSNFKLITEKLGDTVPHSFPYFDEKYAKNISEDSKGFLFDCMILGVGSDGHIGSIFPDFLEKIPEKKLITDTQTDTFPVKNRRTLTFSAIEKSKQILVLLIGEEKENIWEKIQNSKKTLPVHVVLGMKQSQFFWVK